MRIFYVLLVLINLMGCYSLVAQPLLRLTDTMDTEIKNFKLEKRHYATTKEVQVNFTNLVHNMIPFNLGTSNPGISSVRVKWYGLGNYALRTSIGIDGVISRENPMFYFAVGYEHRRILARRFSYTSGWDAYLGNNLTRQVTTPFIGAAGLGLARHYAIEYHINSRMFVSTDAQLMLGSLGDGFGFSLLYPTAIYFNVRL